MAGKLVLVLSVVVLVLVLELLNLTAKAAKRGWSHAKLAKSAKTGRVFFHHRGCAAGRRMMNDE